MGDHRTPEERHRDAKIEALEEAAGAGRDTAFELERIADFLERIANTLEEALILWKGTRK